MFEKMLRKQSEPKQYTQLCRGCYPAIVKAAAVPSGSLALPLACGGWLPEEETDRGRVCVGSMCRLATEGEGAMSIYGEASDGLSDGMAVSKGGGERDVRRVLMN